MTKGDIIDAWKRIREIDAIPDDVLDFMRQSAIQAINRNGFPTDEEILSKLKLPDEVYEDDFMKLEKNSYGTPFLYYNPEGNGRYKCWIQIDESLFNWLKSKL